MVEPDHDLGPEMEMDGQDDNLLQVGDEAINLRQVEEDEDGEQFIPEEKDEQYIPEEDQVFIKINNHS